MKLKKLLSLNQWLLLGLFFGILTGYVGNVFFIKLADLISDIVINLLKLMSLPIIFLSLMSTISGMEGFHEMKGLGSKVIKYTFLTTIISAIVAFILFVIISPASVDLPSMQQYAECARGPSYFYLLKKIIPSNVVQIFSENNVIGALFIALLFGLSILALPKDKKQVLHSFFSSLYAAVITMTGFIAHIMPLGVWAFVALFVKNFQEKPSELENILLYVVCVISANVIQGCIILPLLLKLKGISPWHSVKSMFPALAFAFFSKSSTASLPITMNCAEKNLKVSTKVAHFTLPLCTTINMNGCAAFIFTTVMFVSISNGVSYSIWEMIPWIFISTIAAIGNAGVPMGCYFLSTAFLAAMNVPVVLMGIILPIYAVIDMIETALNVWSDSCVAVIVDNEK